MAEETHEEREVTKKEIETNLADLEKKLVIGQPVNQEILDSFKVVKQKTLYNCDKREKAEALSLIDPLTEIPNIRYFETALNAEFSRAVRGEILSKPYNFTVLFIDINKFKEVNSVYGNWASGGNFFLKLLANLMHKEIKRKDDTVARIGGDEFAGILPDTNIEKALEHIAIPLRDRFYEESSYSLSIMRTLEGKADRAIRDISLAIGLASYTKDSNPTLLINTANSVMYKAKEIYHDNLVAELKQKTDDMGNDWKKGNIIASKGKHNLIYLGKDELNNIIMYNGEDYFTRLEKGNKFGNEIYSDDRIVIVQDENTVIALSKMRERLGIPKSL